MRWYEKLYVGEKAKKHRYRIIQAIREGKASGYYIPTVPSNEKNLLDLYPAFTLNQPYYRDQNLLILGIAENFSDAAELSGRIINLVYQKTGGFDIRSYLLGEE